MAALGKELKAKIEELINILTVEPPSSIDKIELAKKMRAFAILEKEIYSKTSPRLQQSEFGNYILNKGASLKQPIIDLITSLKTLAESKSQKALKPFEQTTLRLKIEALLKVKAFTDIFGDSFEAPSPIDSPVEEKKVRDDISPAEEISSTSSSSPEQSSDEDEASKLEIQDVELKKVEEKEDQEEEKEADKTIDKTTKKHEDYIRTKRFQEVLQYYVDHKDEILADKDLLIALVIRLGDAHDRYKKKPSEPKEWNNVRDDVRKEGRSMVQNTLKDIATKIPTFDLHELSILSHHLSRSWLAHVDLQKAISARFMDLIQKSNQEFNKIHTALDLASKGIKVITKKKKGEFKEKVGEKKEAPKKESAEDIANHFLDISRISVLFYHQRIDDKKAREEIFVAAINALNKVLKTPGALDEIILQRDLPTGIVINEKFKKETKFSNFFLSIAFHCIELDKSVSENYMHLFVNTVLDSYKLIQEHRSSVEKYGSFIGALKQFYDLSGVKAYCKAYSEKDENFIRRFKGCMNQLDNYKARIEPRDSTSLEIDVEEPLEAFCDIKGYDASLPKSQSYYMMKEHLIGVFTYDFLLESPRFPSVSCAIEANGDPFHYLILMQSDPKKYDLEYLDGKSILKGKILPQLDEDMRRKCLYSEKPVVLVNISSKKFYACRDSKETETYFHRCFKQAFMEAQIPFHEVSKHAAPISYSGVGGAAAKGALLKTTETKEKKGRHRRKKH